MASKEELGDSESGAGGVTGVGGTTLASSGVAAAAVGLTDVGLIGVSETVTGATTSAVGVTGVGKTFEVTGVTGVAGVAGGLGAAAIFASGFGFGTAKSLHADLIATFDFWMLGQMPSFFDLEVADGGEGLCLDEAAAVEEEADGLG